ncbi:competence pheromone ComX [Paenibacillus pinihumi]|uniref:competence pheromone ComX n=1 Tax=Paenibacillus pinihumi TaxID=669462 RepID=UPI000425A6F3|nr:competence pheromone ComX [Paenibacillus pinihumi]
MIKNLVAQLKQSPELLNLLLQNRVSLVGVSAVEQRALVDVLKSETLSEKKVNNNYWMSY